MMEIGTDIFAKRVINENDFTILAKTSILDVWQGSEYSSELTSIFKDALF